jgi:hypothetical protein
MLNSRWTGPAWRKPPVRIRYHSPSATALPRSAKSFTTDPEASKPPVPPAISARKASTFAAIRT